jgi:acid phosphatase family membrane protein YuiD
MAVMTLRGLSEEEADRLREEAGRQGISLNALVLRLVREGAGLAKRPWLVRHHELDALAGTWTEEQATAFSAALEETECIDPEMWK